MPGRPGVVVVVAIAASALLISGPPLYGAKALSERVEIRRDTFGVPHILAEDEEAGGFGFGYAMAEDHAAEIGRRYLAARGEAARHFGAGELENDLAMHRLDNRGAARRALADDTGRRFRRWLQGFAAGINRYVETHRESVPSWMPVVEPSDPLAYGRMFGVLAAVRPPARLLEKYPAPQSAPQQQSADDEPGSNAFALSGAKTESGRPILLGNPHLAWSSLYWEAHVTIPGRINFYGSTLVGIPVLRAGFNDRLGYVQTNNAPDLADIYALPITGCRGDACVARQRRVSIEVRQPDGTLATEPREYEDTPLGPVVHRTADTLFVVRSITIEWPRQYEGFFELQQTESLREFRQVLGRGLAVTSNYTYADIDGNILYAWNARLPRRRDPEADYSLDVPGDERRLRWRGVHPASDLPFLLNPPGGYVQNANNPPWWPSVRDRLDPVRFPAYIEREGQLSLRAQLALEALDAAPKFSVDDARRLKHMPRMLMAERTLPGFLAAAAQLGAEASEPLRAGLETLRVWDRRVSADSRGAVLFERFMTLYEREHAEPFAVPWDRNEPMTTPRGLADIESAAAVLERAVMEVRTQYGSERVAWGEVHRFRVGDIDLPGDGAVGRYGVYRVVGFDPAADGTRIAGNVGGDRPLAGFGDAWVLLVHFTRPVTAWSVLAYGQTTNLDSPHSRDQIRLFANHELRPVWFSEEAIAANLERRYRPAGGN